jgi:two-component system, chemotaxis family, sensor histidine kinase and response regulator WspE
MRRQESRVSQPADDFLLDLFRGELETNAHALEAGLAVAEGETRPESIEPWMRAAHSIKGAARMAGIEPVVGLARAMEDVLTAAQRGKAQLTAGVVAALREANRALAELSAEAPGAIPAAAEKRLAALEELGRKLAAPDTAAPPATPLKTAAGPIEGAGAPSPAVDCPGTEPAAPSKPVAFSAAAPQPRSGPVSGPPAPPAPPKAAATSLADTPMLDLFRMELETHARALETGLVAAEGETSPEKIEPLMRASHSIKGAARMVGLDIAVELAHAMEDVLSAAQHGRCQLTSHHVDLLLEGTDCFSALSRLAAEEIPASLDGQAGKLKALGQSLAELLSAPAAPSAPASPATAPASPATAPASPATAPGSPPPAEAPAADRAGKEFVRVFAENLNRLMGLAGECLVQTKSVRPLSAALQRIKQDQYALSEALTHAHEMQVAGAGDGAERLEDLRRHAEGLHALTIRYLAGFEHFTRRLERLSNRLYDEAVATRMRPFSDALPGYPRMVRDLAHSLEKAARLEIEGASTQVDRDILEKLEAPLTHLLRNALDHGLERPEQRVARGKPAEGRVRLAARHVSGMLDITVADDGEGIEIEGLRRKVVAKGYAPEDMAASLTDAELLEFLFLPGFSTRNEVSEVSGRGVGLNIVQSMAREVGGSVRVVTEPGVGTTFHLQLPLTLSVVRSLLLEIGGEPYAIPLARVDRVFRLPRAEVRVVEDRQYCTLDGENVGIVDATQALQLQTPPRTGEILHIAVVSDRLNRYGLVVDRFAGERDLVVIPLHRRLGKVANISAGATLEDGSPVLILDVDDVVRSIDSLLTHGGLKKLRQAGEVSRSSRKRILVVDDSLTVREVERRLLENGGYEVSVAVDGMDGWNALRGGHFDLLVTDIDMPRMDGIELVRRVRSWPPTGSLPVVIVSYKDQEEYRMKGLDAGANAYLTKSSFHDAGLLNTVRDLAGEAQEG